MRILFALLLVSVSIGAASAGEMSLCGTEQLIPISLTPEEMSRLDEIGTYQDAGDPPPAGVRNPGEFEPATGVMVRWPLGVPYDFLIEVSNNTEIWIIVSSAQQASAQTALTNAGVNMSNTYFILGPTDTIWVRDYGPWFIILPDGTQGIFDYDYNRPRPDDDLIPQVIGTQWGVPVYISDLIHTGGNYMSGGLGESMSTNLVYDEDPHSNDWVNQQMEDYLGVTNYTTFEDPQSSYIDHIDCWSKMLSPDRIMVLQVPPSHNDYAALEATADLIAASSSPYGTPWDVYRVYSSGTEGYVNGLLHNDTYYMPVWNTGNDSPAAVAFEDALPGYDVVSIYYSGFANTDALHCRSRNVMDRYMLEVIHTPVDQYQATSPVAITAFIRPNPANTLTSAKLFYRVNSGSFTEITMSPSGSNNFTADIPGNPDGSAVEYYIRAEDSSGRVSAHPQYAPDTWFNSYAVSSAGVSSENHGGYLQPEMLSANPFSSAMVFSGEPGTDYQVYNSAGRLVHNGSADENGTMQWCPESGTQNGVYYTRFTTENSNCSVKTVFIR